MARIYVVQHAEKVSGAGDPPLTGLGRRQAAVTGQWLGEAGLTAIYSSPLLRARQTAECVAAAIGDLPVRLDARLRERQNWDGAQPLEWFLRDWARATSDRDFVPPGGDSSHQAAQRMLSFLHEQVSHSGPIAVVTHGGVTVDVLRDLLGDDNLSAGLIRNGVPACAVTTLDGLTVLDVARTDHLLAR
jgi:broad specificity phosphatase PhoE